MTSLIPRSRLLDLMKAQCRIFNTVYNPERKRMGNKILRQRLIGPSVVKYYPPRIDVVKELRREYPDWQVFDEEEEERLEKIKLQKMRGKGPPKKRTAAESKQIKKKKPVVAPT